jgi:hypothetical protein
MLYYYVVRTHSHTDKQQLWKVMSRRMSDMFTATGWKATCECMEKTKIISFLLYQEKKGSKGRR